MASTGKCEYCGATLLSTEETCPQCGAPNPNYVPEEEHHHIIQPRTIEELKEYCAERGMPLLRMRFFIGEDYREPRAFGIYQDGERFIVYKNKSDGSRAVRYQGKDEAHAVNELFQKLLQECHNRGIYPDGKPEGSVRNVKQRSFTKKFLIGFFVIWLGLGAGIAGWSILSHKNDGYYNFGDGTTYYHYGNDWYTETDYGDWVETEPVYEGDISEYFLGENYTSDWGVSDFKASDTYEELRESESSSSSSDYDSWDSSDTDWDSDW
ncbi:MAG: zinc ribbon domain-containing protein [Solobacterium sp.]|nr:zinc ribbon domain-containing protein [Solobacterium sp.]